MRVLKTCLGSLLLLLGACGERANTPKRPAPKPATAPAAPRPAPAPAPTPRYAGTYAVMDTAVCALSITITRQDTGYRFRCGQWQGPVTVVREEDNTYFTFVGLKGVEPEIDINAAWADTALLIQNYGNSMNEYERFSGCDAKYLTLHRQQP